MGAPARESIAGMRLLPLALAATLLLLQAPVATAQAPPTAVVATTPLGATLAAADRRDELGDEMVLTLRAIEPGSDPDSFAETEAEPVPLWPDEAVVVTENLARDDDDDTERVIVGGAVSADVAAVEQRFDNGRVLRMTTTPGDGYAGRFAGRVRFFAGEIVVSGDDEDDLGQLRMLDASGAVVGVFGYPDAPDRHVRLLRRRAGGILIRIGGTLSAERAPLPLAPEHVRHTLCLNETVGADFGAQEGQTVCQEDVPDLHALRLGGLRGCGARPTTLRGFVPADTRAVVVTLGSGREVRYAARPTPFGRPDRVVAAVLPRGEAIRRVVAVDGAGRRLARGALGIAPPDRRCGLVPAWSDSTWEFTSELAPAQLGTPPGTEVAAADPAGPRLLVRDRGEQLCWGIDELAVDGRDCADPPVNSHGAYLEEKPFAGGLAVAGVFAPRVASLDVILAGGGHIPVELTDGPGYTGRYRGMLRFALFTLPADAKVDGVEFDDAAGQAVGAGLLDCVGCPDADTDPPPKTVLAAGAGRARVRLGAAVSGAGPRRRNACVAFATAGEAMDECELFQAGEGSVGALVSCSPRRTIVYGMTRRSVQRVEIVVGAGRLAARTVAFPRRMRVAGRAFLAVLPRDASVTGVRFPGVRLEDGSSTLKTPFRPARRQCGYTFQADLFSP
jgi:hypothetical protein